MTFLPSSNSTGGLSASLISQFLTQNQFSSAHTLLFTWNPFAPTLCINALTSGLGWNVISPIYVIVSPFSAPLGCITSKTGTGSLLFTVYEDVKGCFLFCPNHQHPLRSISQPSLPLPISFISLRTPKVEFHTMMPTG